jgi:hypothetical protein
MAARRIRRLRTGGRAVALCLLLSVRASVAFAQTPDACTRALAEAEAQYLEGRFDDVLGRLADCLHRSDLARVDAVRAYRLAALAHLMQGNLDDARLSVVQLLGRDPAYEPDPVADLPSYTALVRLVKEQLSARPAPPTEEPGPDEQPVVEAPPSSQEPASPAYPIILSRQRRSWFRANRGWLALAGGSIVAAGVATALVLLGGDGSDTGAVPLPFPPGTPN